MATKKAAPKNAKLHAWVDSIKKLCTPDKVVWCDGSKKEWKDICEMMVKKGQFTKLNQKLRPDCYLARSHESDVARVEGRTFISTAKEIDAGPTNHWIAPDKLKKILLDPKKGLFAGCMKGRTMYVIPFAMGPLGNPITKLGIEITDSPYVVVNMEIMTRVGTKVLAEIEKGAEFVPCLHSVGAPLKKGQKDVAWPCAPMEKKYICQLPEDPDYKIISFGSGYGGNALLGKKCFALRIASVLARDEGWMAEHMLVLSLTSPEKKTYHVTAAFPSACGKTNLAMMLPKLPGWKLETIGDDIAWIKPGADGRLYAINPENGFFGVAPGTNEKSNFNALASTRRGAIFTNVCHNLTNDTVWWEGLDKNPPEFAVDWKGYPWNPSMFNKADKTTYAAHPNSRFTAPAKNCPCVSSEFDKGEGVPISALIFGGRRAKCAPLVYQSRDWEHGVFIGSTMASETTAAAAGAVGVVRRDPMAMLPFCGYNMGDYFQHWLDMGKRLGDKAPKIFNVNWFRTDDEGNFIWPGYGENARVLNWIVDRCEGKADAELTAIGYVPKPEDIDLTDLDIDRETLKGLLQVDKDVWTKEVEEIEVHYKKFGDKLPAELSKQLDTLRANVAAL
jgi:phosphoenolpyruvate carboxykinase (GTP)